MSALGGKILVLAIFPWDRGIWVVSNFHHLPNLVEGTRAGLEVLDEVLVPIQHALEDASLLLATWIDAGTWVPADRIL